jgi:DNA mismatch repair ATPase MutS
MKAFLLHAEQDFDLEAGLPPGEEALTQDLEADTLFAAMARGDEFLFEVARRAVLSSLVDPDAIAYRQAILRDCLEHPDIVREIYDLAVEAIVGEKKIYFGIFSHSPDTILSRAIQVLEMFSEMLKRLRQMSDEHAARFGSAGFVRLFRTLSTELDDEYLQTVDDHLQQLRFRSGTVISAELGKGNKGTRYVLRRSRKQSWRERIPFGDRSSYSFQIPDRDQNGFRALADLRGRGINLVANALAQSTDHILSFFRMLRAELGFYVGCLNLHEQLAEKGEPTCFPEPSALGEPALAANGLYDVCLSLTLAERVVGNDVTADGKSLVMITGANQGGKSTFLRSVGLAQLMMQSGMFVAAESFRADVRDGLFTHFKREEDVTMQSGKLDEELRRMSEIVENMRSRSLALCNESFASTNEREGSEIARQIIRALLEAGIKVFFVTHMFDLAHGLYSSQLDTAVFLRAERRDDGSRTFRLVEGEPLPTSYGEDLYRRIFGRLPDAARAAREPSHAETGSSSERSPSA